jgi:succinoglycan biosynthesis transport protein ExoP
MSTAASKPEDAMALPRYCLVILKRHKHTVFLASLLLAIAGIVVVSLLPNEYRATTTILVDPQKIPEKYVSSTVTSDPNAHLNTLTQQVLSASRIQAIVEHANLYPELRKKKTREEVIDFIRSKIKIELKQGTEQGLSSFSISYSDANRWLVAPVANQLATNFIEWNLKARQQQAIGTTEFLASELESAQKSLQEQEEALQTFRLQHAGATPDQLDGNLQALSRLQAEVQSHMDSISRLDEERILLTQQKSVISRDPTTLTERGRLVQDKNRLESELSTLRRQFTDTYPDVITAQTQLDQVNARLAAMPVATDSSDSYDSGTQLRLKLIAKEIESHNQKLTYLQGRIGSYQGKVQSVPILETQLAELTRNYETSKQNYQSLLDKRLSAGMSEDLERKQQAERFMVLDPASTPEKPSSPKRLPIIAGTIVAAFLISCGLTIGITLLNGAIRSDSDLLTVLPAKVRILATIPSISSQKDQQQARLKTTQVIIVSVCACALLITFLLKVRPVL